MDAAYTWNSSQVWSDNVVSSDGSYYAGRPPSNLFDGDTSTQCSTSTQSAGVSLTASFSGVSYTDKIEVFSLNTNTIQVNDKPEVTAVTGQWNTAATGGGTLSSIVFTSTNPNGTAGAAAIMVDGELLVDAGFGASGFYLPFDPAQTGVNYSSNATGMDPSEPASNGFDGTTALATSDPTNGSGGVITFNDISFSKLEIQGFTRAGAFNVVTASGTTNIGSVIGSSPSNGGTKVDVTTLVGGAGVLKSFGLNSDGSTLNSGFSNVWIDGALLVDHSSIGVDMSGNNNNFFDQNFGVGDSSQVWSKTANEYWATATPASQAFDGSIATRAYPNDSSLPNSANVTFTSPVPINSSLRAFVGTGSNNTNGTVSINGSDVTSQLPNGASDGQWVTITGFSTLTSVAVGRTNSTTYSSLYAVEVDGVKLINPSAVDQVLDTPMKNYAVLDSSNKGANVSLSNGGLAYSSSARGSVLSTIPFSSGGKHYYEYTHTANTSFIGIAVGDTNVEQYVGRNPNTYGYASDSGSVYSGDIVKATGETYDVGDVIGVAYDTTSRELKFFKNGVESVALTADDNDYHPALGNTTDAGSVNFGQQPWVHTPPAGYEGLYQTWDEYARSSLGYALDRIAQLETLRLADASTIEDLRTQIAGALSRIASIEADEVNDDAVDSALITLVGSLNSQVTTWSTRIATAEAAIAAAEGRIDTLES